MSSSSSEYDSSDDASKKRLKKLRKKEKKATKKLKKANKKLAKERKKRGDNRETESGERVLKVQRLVLQKGMGATDKAHAQHIVRSSGCVGNSLSDSSHTVRSRAQRNRKAKPHRQD